MHFSDGSWYGHRLWRFRICAQAVSLVSLAEACLGFNKGARWVILDSLAGVTSAHPPWVARNLNSIARFLALM